MRAGLPQPHGGAHVATRARFARERDNSAHLRDSRVTHAPSSLKHGAAPECLHSGAAAVSVQVGPRPGLGSDWPELEPSVWVWAGL